MEFFTETYKRYNTELKNCGDLAGECSNLISSMSTISTSLSQAQSSANASSWEELGMKEITTTTFPALSNNVNDLKSNFESGLQKVISILIDQLLPKTDELKAENENLEAIEAEIKSLVAPAQTDSKGNTNPAYTTYINKKEELLGKKEESRTKCKNLKSECDALVSQAKGLDSAVKDIKLAEKPKLENQDLYGNKLLELITFEGKKYFAIKTANGSVIDFSNALHQYGLTQTDHAAAYGNSCLGVAKAYGNRILGGINSSNMDAFYSGAYTTYDGGTQYSNLQDALEVIYNEIKAGRPCVIDVISNQTENKGANNRHFATVVGIRSDVKSAKDLKEEDLLIIDSWDGNLEDVNHSDDKDRHMRLDRGSGTYRVDVLKA